MSFIRHLTVTCLAAIKKRSLQTVHFKVCTQSFQNVHPPFPSCLPLVCQVLVCFIHIIFELMANILKLIISAETEWRRLIRWRWSGQVGPAYSMSHSFYLFLQAPRLLAWLIHTGCPNCEGI